MAKGDPSPKMDMGTGGTRSVQSDARGTGIDSVRRITGIWMLSDGRLRSLRQASRAEEVLDACLDGATGSRNGRASSDRRIETGERDERGVGERTGGTTRIRRLGSGLGWRRCEGQGGSKRARSGAREQARREGNGAKWLERGGKIPLRASRLSNRALSSAIVNRRKSGTSIRQRTPGKPLLYSCFALSVSIPRLRDPREFSLAGAEFHLARQRQICTVPTTRRARPK